MNRLHRWNWLVLTAALVALPFTTTAQAAGISASQGSSTAASQAELEQMLAPIALYPDSLLTHILITSTYPLELVQAQRWLTLRPKSSIDQIMSQVEDKDWDPSVKALLAFPTLLQKMSEDLEWTQRLGEAFLEDEGQVMNSIQSLRQQADKANSLADMDNMAITRANNQIIIEPAKREIVYVPYYDPRVVYGTWRWGVAYPPVYWEFGGYAGYPYRPSHNHFYWSPGIHISFNYFFSSFHWHKHKVVVIDYRHSHRYRPRERYSVSHGAQPWKHKPEHRRGVSYHNPVVKKRYYNEDKYRNRDSHSSGNKQHFNSQYSKSKERQDPRSNLGNVSHQGNKSRDNKDSHNVSGARDNRAPSYQQRQYQTRESQPRNIDQQRAQSQRQEKPRTVTPRVETQRPETRRTEPQRIEQPRQAAPRQREEVRVRQSEPRQNAYNARSVEHNQGRSTQNQERRHRE